MKEILGSPYKGKKAANYDTKRKLQRKWHDENRCISEMLADATGTLLDVAVGTGRFLPTYEKLKLKVTGLDISKDMLAIAAKYHRTSAELMLGNAVALPFKNKFDTVVCVRLLHLVDDQTMRKMLAEVCRVAGKTIVLTIQLGFEYHTGHDTATHDSKKFYALLSRLGWRVNDDRKLTGAGWHMMQLVKKR